MAAPRFHLSNLDAVDWLRGLPPGQVDLLITDPPYESLEKHRAVGTTTRLKHSKSSSNDWFTIFPNARFEELFTEVFRVLKKDAHFYLFCDAETMFVAKPIAEAVGFKFWKPLVWDKQKIGMGYHYRARYELVLFFEKGKRKLNDLGIPDIISAPRIRDGYPTEKPVQVCEVLVRQSSEPGQVVADPFCGAGSACRAAIEQGRHALGNDLAAAALELTGSRLRDSGAVESGLVEILGPPPAPVARRPRQLGRSDLAPRDAAEPVAAQLELGMPGRDLHGKVEP
jgi:site-specific DNA-methyltransferase (adenine-specific)